jgi:hypothetical protein
MKKYDMGSSLFWLLFSLFVCIESLRLGIGTLQRPGMGFMPFGTSGLLAIISLIQLFHTIFKEEDIKIQPIFYGSLWQRVIPILVASFVYAKLMPLGGYLISTFLLMSFLFWIVKGQKWWRVLVFSFLTTFITYYLFSVWLKGGFPVGPFGY